MKLLLLTIGRMNVHHGYIFICRPYLLDKDEEGMLVEYPPPLASKFAATRALLDTSLTKENYRTRLHDLLYIEEMAQFSSIAK